MRALAALPLFFSVLGNLPWEGRSPPGLEEDLRRQVERLREDGSITVGTERIAFSPELAAYYERRGFHPVWIDPRRVEDLLRCVRGAEEDGLDPRSYHLGALASAGDEGLSRATAAGIDLLRTDALLRLATHLRFGKVDPSHRELEADLSRAQTSARATVPIDELVAEDDLATSLASLRPSHYVYSGLREALGRHRVARDQGGWPTLGRGRALRMGDADPAVPLLRRRLRLTGDLRAPEESESTLFDAEVHQALRRFQHRHGLNEDGVLGAATRAEVDVPVEMRIDQLRVNLERARWIVRDLAESFVAVNVAGQKLHVVRDGSAIWETRVVVGKTATRTPIFSALMTYIVLNPAWEVPRSIAGEVLAEARLDATYLASHGFRILDTAGREIDPETLDLGASATALFPYHLRQEPGPQNALGRIKLVFPNDYSVYLHDTPGRSLFERERRTFSHGCIRVQDPLRLAELVLDDPAHWSRDALAAAIESGSTQTLALKQPLPVLILYWTAATDLEGVLHFYRDVYGRDAGLLRALDEH